MRPTLSLCMITKNEEKNIKRCLESIHTICDEILIADTGSTDSTIEIAKKYNSKIYHFKWSNDFSAARNFIMSKSNSDYILFLDADEEVVNPDLIEKCINSLNNYYYVSIHNYLSTENYRTDKVVRLFKNRLSNEYIGRIHEHLNMTKEDEVIETNLIINHFGYLENEYQLKGKSDRNHKLLLAEVAERPTSFAYYNLGVYFMNTKNYEKASSHFEMALSKQGSGEYLYKLYCFYTETLINLNLFDKALNFIEGKTQMIDKNCSIYIRAIGYMKYKKFKKAISLFKELLAHPKDDFFFNYFDDYSNISLIKMSNIYLNLGQVDTAIEISISSLSQCSTDSLRWHIKLISMLNWPKPEILNTLNELIEIGYSQEDIISILINLRHTLMLDFNSMFLSVDEISMLFSIYRDSSFINEDRLRNNNHINDCDLYYNSIYSDKIIQSRNFEHLDMDDIISTLEILLLHKNDKGIELFLNQLLENQKTFNMISIIDILYFYGQSYLLEVIKDYIIDKDCKDLIDVYYSILTDNLIKESSNYPLTSNFIESYKTL